MASPTQFKLQRIETRVGPVALVTMDNGEDWQKPNTFGEAALRSLEGVLDQLRTSDWRGLLLTGKPFVFAVGADIDEFGDITPERARLGGELEGGVHPSRSVRRRAAGQHDGLFRDRLGPLPLS